MDANRNGVKWGRSLGGRNRLAVVGVAAAVAAAAIPPLVVAIVDKHGGLELSLWALAELVAVAALAASLIWALADVRAQRERRNLRLLVPVARVSKVDPLRIGVAVPALPELVDKYLTRNPADTTLDQTVATALGRADHWIVVVAGPSTVGKSRTLFEALKRYDSNVAPLNLVAPSDAAALRMLFDNSEGG